MPIAFIPKSLAAFVDGCGLLSLGDFVTGAYMQQLQFQRYSSDGSNCAARCRTYQFVVYKCSPKGATKCFMFLSCAEDSGDDRTLLVITQCSTEQPTVNCILKISSTSSVVLSQRTHVTDRQTGEIAVANTAFACNAYSDESLQKLNVQKIGYSLLASITDASKVHKV